MSILRSETRIIRPFKGLQTSVDLLNRVELKQGQKVYSPGTVILSKSKLKEQNFLILLNAEKEELLQACNNANLSPKDVSLYVFANSRSLRKSTLIFEMKIQSDTKLPKEISIEDNYGDDLSRYVFLDSAGFQINVALVLNNDLPFEPLKIHRSGTFLARSTFNLKPEEDLSSFAPEPLTDILRADFNLPKTCMTYVFVQETILNVEDLSEAITVYLDSEILNLLLIDESDGLAKHFQINLAIQTVETILISICRALESDGIEIADLSDNSGSLSFIQKLSADLGIEIDEILSFAKEDVSKLRSLLEAKFKIQNTVEQLLKRGQ